MTRELKTITVITVYLTIVGLVYKFKANILMHLLFSEIILRKIT